MVTRTRARRALITTCATALLALAAGCSDGSDDPGDAATESATEASPADDAATDPAENEGDGAAGEDDQAAELETTVRAYTTAYGTDPDAAYAMLSERCVGELTPAAFTAALEQATAVYGELTVETLTVDSMDGDMARVTYTTGIPAVDETLVSQAWVREDNAWRHDGC